MTGVLGYTFPQEHGRATIALYEIFDCTHPICQESQNCTAQWKWYVPFTSQDAIVCCKGSHCPQWRPTLKLYRGLTTYQRQTVRQQTATFGTTSTKIAEGLSVNTRIVRNFMDHENRKKRLSKDHFQAFKMELQELIKKSSDLHVIVPQGSIESMMMNSFSVLLVSKSLISFAVENGRIFKVIGHDAVYKVTDQGIPINLYTTVTKKDFRGIILGYSIASHNKASVLKELIRSFLLYLRETFPANYKRPMFSVDEENSQINALLQLEIDFCICRFHLKRCWRKHIVKKVPNDMREKVAVIMLRLLGTKEKNG